MSLKNDGPESPADLRWSQGAKNPRKESSKKGYGTQNSETSLHNMEIDNGTQICETSLQNQNALLETAGTHSSDTSSKRTANRLINERGVGPHTNPSTSQVTVGEAPRFLLVKREEDNFDKISPFKISKILYGLIGEIKNVRKIRDGLLVETKTANQSRRLLQVKKFGDFFVEVVPHETLNSCKGVVYCPDLLNCSTEEIIDELKTQGVINVRRLKTKRNGLVIETPNHVLTFNKPSLPIEIKAAFHILKVRPYIPQPTRCFNCQAIGHPASRCARIKICPCGDSHDELIPCRDPKICVNCRGPHSAAYLNCPKLKEEAAIQKVKATENISYGDAKRRVKSQTPKPNISYAAATSSQSSIPHIELSVLTTQIENIVKNTLLDFLQKPDFRIPATVNEPIGRERSDSVSTNLSITSEKRKKPDDSTTEEETNERPSQNASKKKKGWPKGQPRK